MRIPIVYLFFFFFAENIIHIIGCLKFNDLKWKFIELKKLDVRIKFFFMCKIL